MLSCQRRVLLPIGLTQIKPRYVRILKVGARKLDLGLPQMFTSVLDALL